MLSVAPPLSPYLKASKGGKLYLYAFSTWSCRAAAPLSLRGLEKGLARAKDVETVELNGKAVAVDVSENEVAFGSKEKASNVKTEEGALRATCFLRRRSLRSKPRLNEEPLLARCRGRE